MEYRQARICPADAILRLIEAGLRLGGAIEVYRSAHELIGVFRVGKTSHLNNVELGRHGRSRSNVWHYAGVNSSRAGRMEELRSHPSAKPVGLIADAIKDCTRRGDVVLDTFCGLGIQGQGLEERAPVFPWLAPAIR